MDSLEDLKHTEISTMSEHLVLLELQGQLECLREPEWQDEWEQTE